MISIDRVILYECRLRVTYKGTYTTGWTDPDISIFLLEIRAGDFSGFGECVAVNLFHQPKPAASVANVVPTMFVFKPDYNELELLLQLCQSLIGKDPSKLGRLIPQSAIRHESNNLIDAIDFALHDLVGKAYGIPAGLLLGGIGKEFVFGMPVIYTADPETMSEKAREWYRQYGFRYFKLKPNGNVEMDEATLRKIREKTSAEIEVFADANFALKMDGAGVVAYLNHLQKFGLGMCEDPINASLEEYAQIRSRSKVPIMIDYQARTEADVLNIVNLKAAHAINIHANWAGGFQQGLRRAQLAALGEVDVMIGSTHYLGVGTAAYQILASQLPGNLPCEQVHVEVSGGVGVVKNPFKIQDGKIFISDKPGLGVEPDLEKLKSISHRVHEIY